MFVNLYEQKKLFDDLDDLDGLGFDKPQEIGDRPEDAPERPIELEDFIDAAEQVAGEFLGYGSDA